MTKTVGTMSGMILLDKMTPHFLEAGDVLKINSKFYSLIECKSMKEGFKLVASDDWGDVFEFDVPDDALIPVYVEEYED